MSFSLFKALNIKKEEEKPVLLLVLYSFFMGASVAFYYTASISLFLHNFQRDMLPYVYIAGGLVIYTFGIAFKKAQHKLSMSKILLTGILFLLLTSGMIIIGYIVSGNKWIAFLMFIWINVFLFIHGVGFNGMASRLFTLHQGKRLYAIIGVGEVVSNVLGFFSVPLILKLMPTEYMALITLFALVITLFVLLIITRTYRKELTLLVPERKPASSGKKQVLDFMKNRFTFFLFILALLPVFGMYFVDFVFFGQTQLAFPQKEVLSGFIGIFFGVMAVVEFLIKTFVYGRLVEKFGVRPGLVGLPVLLLFSTILASLSGSFFGVAFMFSFVVLSKLFIRSVRNSVNDPSYLILYQVLPAEERFAFQGKLEGGPKAVSNIIVGAVIILLTLLHFSLVQFNYVFILVLIFWTWASFRMYAQYKNELKNILKRKSTLFIDDLEEELAQITLSEKNRGNSNPGNGPLLNILELARMAASKEPEDRALAAGQLGASGRYQAVQLLSGLMLDTDPQVRKTALVAAGKIKSHELWPYLLDNLTDENFCQEAYQTLSEIGQPVLPELDVLLKKVQDQPLNGTRIISLFGRIGGREGIKRLKNLMNHPDYPYRKEALLALGRNHYKAASSEKIWIKQVIEGEVNMIVWATACIWDLKDHPGTDALIDALQEETETGRQFLFTLLSLIFEPSLMHYVREQYMQQSSEAKIYALELFDMMVTGDIKEMVVPLLEEMPIHETLHAYRNLYPQEHFSFKDRLFDIILQDYSRISVKTKTLAIQLLERFPLAETSNILYAHLPHRDPRFWQSACRVLVNKDKDSLLKRIIIYGINRENQIRDFISHEPGFSDIQTHSMQV
ncbi:MAG: HEAT repeat domain-containing protein [Bacteroidetes bacterium]|nr:HEAT repeat domain-containing protein [Bacteroidota bacterium]